MVFFADDDVTTLAQNCHATPTTPSAADGRISDRPSLAVSCRERGSEVARRGERSMREDAASMRFARVDLVTSRYRSDLIGMCWPARLLP
jgi:hypothetical protein